ncbi:hypothetical protein [Maioricimonas rarisocia]|nr:hypothetical protein [Maioricimonas rarisocia]
MQLRWSVYGILASGMLLGILLGVCLACALLTFKRPQPSLFLTHAGVDIPSNAYYRRNDIYETGLFGVDGYRLLGFGVDRNALEVWMEQVAELRGEWLHGPLPPNIGIHRDALPSLVVKNSRLQYIVLHNNDERRETDVLIADTESSRVWLYLQF